MTKILYQAGSGYIDLPGEIVKQDDRYTVRDNNDLKTMAVSTTKLYPGCSTSGHSHKGQEEVYIFQHGTGYMYVAPNGDIGKATQVRVEKGDIVLIEDGDYHRVENDSDHEDLYFVCIIPGGRKHK